MQTLTIEASEEGQRFDKFLRKYFREAGSGFLYKMLRKKNITLNGHKASGSEILAAGDAVRFFLSDETIQRFRGSAPALAAGAGKAAPSHVRGPAMPPVLYRDGDVLILNKPAGMLVQPAPGGTPSIAGLLPEWMLSRGWIEEKELRAFRPAPANRIDRNTSGIVLCGASLRGLQVLSEAMRERSADKEYLALTSTPLPPDGVYRAFVRRQGGVTEVCGREPDGCVPIETGLTRMWDSPAAALVRLRLITGRTHQLRAHLAHLGAPILGDPRYGDAGRNRRILERYGVRRQLLHASGITFPDSFPLARLAGHTVTAPLPEDFRQVLRGELPGCTLPG